MPASDDLFTDTTMTFGEHLEELRQHLWRAIWGIGIAALLMCWKADLVVKLITEPVERQQQDWYRRTTDRRAKAYQAAIDQLPLDERPRVKVEARLSPTELAEIARALGTDERKAANSKPVSLDFTVPVGDLIREISVPLAVVNRLGSLRTLSAQESVVIYFEAVLGAAIVLSSPWVFYQVYSFIAVGLYAHERRVVNLTLPFAVGLFLLGVAMCYFVVFPSMLSFFLWTNEWMDLEPETRLSEWVGFAVILMLIFGVIFQMPLLMLMLERVGIVTHEQLAGKRRLAIFINFIVAAAITPGGDPNTLFLLGVPMCLLFELGLFLMKRFERKNPFSVADPFDEVFEKV